MREPRRKHSWRRSLWIALLAPLPFLVVVGYIAWSMFWPHVYDSGAGGNAADVTKYTSTPPPAEASNIHTASYDAGQARVVFVRFTAAPAVCRGYAQSLARGAAIAPIDWHQAYDDLTTIRTGTWQLDDLRWFDLPYAKSGWSVTNGKNVFTPPSGMMPDPPTTIVGCDLNTETEGYLGTSIRVDLERGVFYYLRVN